MKKKLCKWLFWYRWLLILIRNAKGFYATTLISIAKNLPITAVFALNVTIDGAMISAQTGRIKIVFRICRLWLPFSRCVVLFKRGLIVNEWRSVKCNEPYWRQWIMLRLVWTNRNYISFWGGSDEPWSSATFTNLIDFREVSSNLCFLINFRVVSNFVNF